MISPTMRVSFATTLRRPLTKEEEGLVELCRAHGLEVDPHPGFVMDEQGPVVLVPRVNGQRDVVSPLPPAITEAIGVLLPNASWQYHIDDKTPVVVIVIPDPLPEREALDRLASLDLVGLIRCALFLMFRFLQDRRFARELGSYPMSSVVQGALDSMVFPSIVRVAETLHAFQPPIFGVGDRVVRGPDWSWGDQDGGGPGTVTLAEDGWSIVRWDTGEDDHRYRDGAAGKRDLSPFASA